MHMEHYVEEALKTESTIFNLTEDKLSILHGLLTTIDELTEHVDMLKKSIFYGKEIDMEPMRHFSSEDKTVNLNDYETESIQRLLHAGLGLVTEALEFTLPLVDGKKDYLDVTNLKEELGDSFWYQAIASDALDSNFEELQEMNINKLRIRYPDKFKASDAEHRDIAAERTALNM